MSNQRYGVTIDVGANISQAKSALEKLREEFNKGFSKGENKNLYNLFGDFEKAFSEYERRAKGPLKTSSDIAKLKASQEQVIRLYDEISRSVKNVGKLGDLDFLKAMGGISPKIEEATNAIDKYNKVLSEQVKEEKKLQQAVTASDTALRKKNETLTNKQTDLKAAKQQRAEARTSFSTATQEAKDAADAVKNAEIEVQNADAKLTSLKQKLQQKLSEFHVGLSKGGNLLTTGQSGTDKLFSGLIKDSDLDKVDRYLQKINELQNKINNPKTTSAKKTQLGEDKKVLSEQLNQFLKDTGITLNKKGTAADRAAASAYNEQVEKAAQAKIDELNKLLQEVRDAEESLKKQQDALRDEQQKSAAADKKAETAKNKKITAEANFTKAEAAAKTAQGDVDAETNKLKEAQKALQEFQQAAANLVPFDTLKEKLKGIIPDDVLNKITHGKDAVNTLLEEVKKLSAGDLDASKEKWDRITEALKQYDEAQKKANKDTEEHIELSQRQIDQEREISGLKSRIQYFFGLANALNLVKRAIRSAFNTVKELDAAMTETAVVTEYTVKDMWKQLPEYTKRANQLGVTTKAAYESATLYYQQGLNTEQAAALSTETLKMARIAGLDAADATDRMTNALRGFNMELNATQAQRVDDVYSQLAAMSASNVDEISTAMTKVASLANNANMEFETTAAFLAQIIETTRESAETAGTALKTVVARFSEVKKLVDTDQLKGQDEEGQAIDVNKVSQALRTAGIDLNKYFLGEVGLDDIFMELASKWDSLTNIQQRYIATQAAGSRQQSRFIALMSDYARTQELVGAAYSSNGASQKQFEKTQDSMESKLARLKNAWDEFAMGLANNGLIKGAVDVLTTILQLINKISAAFGSGVGSIIKWGAAIGGLFGAKSLFKSGGAVEGIIRTVARGTAFSNVVEKAFNPQGLGGGTGQGPSGGQGNTRVYSGGLLRGLFNGDFKKKIQEFKKNNANPVNRARPELWQEGPGAIQETSLFSALGNKFKGTGLGGKIAKSGLAKKLGTDAAGAATGAATLGAALIYVAGAAAAVAAAYALWYNLSPEGQLKQAKKWAETMDKVSESAEKTKTSTKEAYETYKQRNEAVETATTVTGKKKAIQERNEYINGLIQKDSSYAKYLKTSFDNKTGELVLNIDEADMKQVADDAAKNASNAAAQSSLAQAMMAGKQANVYEAQARRVGANINDQTITRYDEDGSAYTDKMTQAEIAKYSDLALKQSQQKDLMRTYAQTAYARMVDSTKVGAEVADLVSGVMAEAFDEDQYLKEIKRQSGGTGSWVRSRAHWQEEYLKAYGQEADSSMKTADIARAVASSQAQKEEQKKTDQITELAQKEEYKDIFRALSGEVDIELSTNIDQYISGLDESGKKLQEIANILYGGDISKIQEAIKKNAELAKTLQKTNLASIATMGMKKGVKGSTLEKFLGMSADNIAKVLNFSEAAEKSLGEGFTKFLDEIPNYSDKELDSLNTFFGSFNLDDPISALKKLNTVVKNETDPLLKGVAEQILESNKDTLKNKGYLTQVFMTSEAYEGISENLEKFIEDNEEITAENINELAESCSDLKTLMNEADISAQSLARAFTAVGKGEASMDGITSSVLEALNATNLANNAVDAFFKKLDEFDTGRDYGKALDFMQGKVEELEKSLENLDFGNETFRNNYKLFFDDYDDFIKKDTAGRKSALQANIDRIKGLLDNDALGAMQELTEKLGNQVTQLDKEGFIFKWTPEGDFNDTVADIQKALGVTEEIATTILTTAMSKMPGLKEAMDQKGYEKTLDQFITDSSTQKIWTEQELQVLASSTGKDIDVIRDDLQARADEKGITLPVEVKWQDDDGKPLTGDNLYTYFTEKIGDKGLADISLTGFKDIYDDGTSAYDPDKMVQKIMSDYKMSEGQAKSLADSIVANVEGGAFEKTIKMPVEPVPGSGEWEIQDVKVTAGSIEDLEKEIKLKEDQAQWTQIGQAMADAISQGLDNITITPAGDGSQAAADVKADLAKTSYTVKVTGIYSGLSGDSTDNTSRGNAPEEHADGGIVPSHAKGTKRIKPGIALTGEEGPELIWNKQGGYAYLVGKHGPEFANLVPGDQVFPADETKDIIRRGVTPSLAKGGKVVPSYSDPPKDGEGDWSNHNNNNNNNNKKKKKEDTEGAKLDLDKYYNLVEDINELLRIRNLLEKDYEQLLKNEGKTGKEIYDNLTRQLDLLEERRKIVEDLAQKRKQQILDLVEENKEYGNYAWWNDSDQTIEIDWDAVQEIEDKDTASAVKDYLSKLEDFQGKYDDMIEQLEEIESNVQEIKKRGKDQYDSLEERVRDALIKQIQDKIDELTEVDKAINDTNQKLFDSMQDTLQKQRQERDNAKTEEDLTDKEKRLAYLQQDSSNANALEIAKLQEELADARQDYTDNLIDQKISELQKQNDEAQEQRQEQIDLMQRSLDWQEKSGAFWETVYQYISEGTDAIGALVKQSELERLLMSAEPWDKLSEEQKLNWVNDLMDQVAQGIAYLEMQRQLEDIGTKEGTSISFTNANGQTLTGKADKNGNVVVTNKDGSTVTYKDVFQDYHGAYRTFETSGEAKAAPKPVTTTKSTTTTSTNKNSTTSAKSGTNSTSSTTNNNKEEEAKLLKEWYTFQNDSTCMRHREYQKGKETYELTAAVSHIQTEFRGVSGSDRIFYCGNCRHTFRVKNNYPTVTTATTITKAEEEKKKRGYGPNPGGCFVAGTKIIMANYIEKNIEDIKINDYVFAYNECLKIFEPKKVTKSYVHYNTPFIMTLILSNSLIIKMTPGHPILTTTGWKSMDIENSLYEHGVIVKELQINDEIIGYGNNVFIKDIIIKENVDNINVYNIEVEDLHTFVANKIVVHNMKVDAYASGGLNTRTGLAWLDGTTSSPELVLNARDTQNFIELKDVLADMRKGGNFSLNGGDNYYDIKVQVDSLGSDYDVDRAIDRIKARIAQDGAYRNVNTLSRLR